MLIFAISKLKQYISEEVRKIINGKSVSLNKETLVEMARINLKEVENMENTYNKALKEDTEEAWDEWVKA